MSLVSCGSEKPVSFVMSEANPDGSIAAQVDAAFIAKAEELSGGKIKIQLYTNGTLGDNTAVMEVMTKPNSEIHLARVAPAAVVKYGCPLSELLDIPYTFESREHFWSFASSPAAKKLLDEPYENNIGVKGLFFAEEGFRHFFSTKPLEKPSDFDGKKIRSAGNSLMTEIIKAYGGETIPVSFAKLYSALQTGQVEIAEQPIVNYLANHFNKIAPYMILDSHQLGLHEVVITTQAWESLSKNQQNILVEAGKYAGEYCMKISQDAEDKAKASLEAEGAVLANVENHDEWRNMCSDVINKASKENIKLYEEIIGLAK